MDDKYNNIDEYVNSPIAKEYNIIDEDNDTLDVREAKHKKQKELLENA